MVAEHRFTEVLYTHLAQGDTIGDATTEARRNLLADRRRGRIRDHALELDDWHVPVLLQQGPDRALLPGGAEAHVDPKLVEARQLASVADRAGRLEESVDWSRRALEAFRAGGHRAYEARSSFPHRPSWGDREVAADPKTG